MKKIILISICALMFYCKSASKEKKEFNNSKKNTHSKFNSLNSVVLPNYPLWLLNRLTLNKETDTYKGNAVFNIERNSTSETAYALVNNIAVVKGQKYNLSILVKKASSGNFFGIRMMAAYPNRIDAVFDLTNGINNQALEAGNFLKGTSEMKYLGDGWYRCSIQLTLNVSRIKIILGPTNESVKTGTWEAAINKKCNIQIIPSSLNLTQL